MKLTECLPEIIDVDTDTPDANITNTNFQRFSCSIEAASKIYSHRVDSLHDLALHFNKSLTTSECHESKAGANEGEQEQQEKDKVLSRLREQSNTIEEDETKLTKPLKDIMGRYTDPIFIHMRRNLKGTHICASFVGSKESFFTLIFQTQTMHRIIYQTLFPTTILRIGEDLTVLQRMM